MFEQKEVLLGEKVGEGAFASVFSGYYRNEQVAVKRLNMAGKTEDHIKKIFAEFRREVTTMRYESPPAPAQNCLKSRICFFF